MGSTRFWQGQDVEDAPRAAAWLNELEAQAYGGSLPAFESAVTGTIATIEDLISATSYFGTISAYKTIQVFDALYDCRATAFQLTCNGGAVAGDAANFWTVILRRRRPGVGGSYDATVLADSPSAYWKLNESSGTSAADSSAGGTATGTYNGTVTLGATPAPYFVDTTTCVTFDGSTANVSVANGTPITLGTGPFTIEAIAKHAVLGVQQTIIGKDAYTMYVQSNDRLAFGSSGATHSPKALSRTFVDQNWHHFACVCDGTGSAKVYIDGVDVTSDEVTDMAFVDNTTVLRIGDKPGGSQFFNGQIHKVAVYKTALSQARVQAHAQAAFGGDIIAMKATLPLTSGGNIPHPGGEPIVQYQPWTFDAIPLNNNTLQPGDTIDALLVPTGSPSSLVDPRFALRYEAVS